MLSEYYKGLRDMKKLIAMFALVSVSVPALAAAPSGRGRASMANQMDARATVSQKQINNVVASAETTQTVVVEEEKTDVVPEKPKDMREREKAACMQNNIGVGATFVWASRYSNTANYASMTEDVEFPENNVCFVKVAMKSNDSRIDVSDIPAKYFVMGDNITCGQWANEEALKQRILDAKKKGRTWATVGGAVGGAAVGVGAMELFGNKLLSNAGVSSVEGQAALTGTELLCSQMKVLKQEKSSKYSDIKAEVQKMAEGCDASKWGDGAEKPTECTKYDYAKLLNC